MTREKSLKAAEDKIESIYEDVSVSVPAYFCLQYITKLFCAEATTSP
jgi:hypothetical protein